MGTRDADGPQAACGLLQAIFSQSRERATRLFNVVRVHESVQIHCSGILKVRHFLWNFPRSAKTACSSRTDVPCENSFYLIVQAVLISDEQLESSVTCHTRAGRARSEDGWHPGQEPAPVASASALYPPDVHQHMLLSLHAVGPGECKRVRAGVSTNQTAIFPDASRTPCLSLSLAAGQRRSWLHTRSNLFAREWLADC